ncbi:MAG: hypothetical protein HOG49_08390 [Candidatus Scalindua sp.]|jgi:hypothetical protein|nr:hypothetical protein [Candidatus Scalindua sp.]
MVILTLGIFFRVVGFTMIIWSKRRKYYELHKLVEEDYFDHVFSKFISNSLWFSGAISVVLGCIMVGVQEYSDATWLAVILLFIIFWLVQLIPINFK